MRIRGRTLAQTLPAAITIADDSCNPRAADASIARPAGVRRGYPSPHLNPYSNLFKNPPFSGKSGPGSKFGSAVGGRRALAPPGGPAAPPLSGGLCVGSHNPSTNPRLEVLARLAQLGVATYRTDTTGAVTFYLDGERVTPLPGSLRR